MITLITGGPGTGKTAWLLDQLLELRKHDPQRKLYIHGVRNLRGIDHETIYCRSDLCDICRSDHSIDKQADELTDLPVDAVTGDIVITQTDEQFHIRKYVEDWLIWKQKGALIVVDEVQRIWRPRGGSSAPPIAVSGLETHRHYGLDFWLISQGPHLFDNFIRLLVGRHVHLVAKWSGRTQYEWPECKQNVHLRSDAVMRPYKLPKRVYNMYNSAEVHTTQEKRKPLSFYATIVAIIIAVILITFSVYRIKQRVTSPANVEAGEGVALAAQSTASTVSRPVSSVSSEKRDFPDFTPKIAGVPESAPAYSDLVKVTAVPLLAGCILSKKSDKCTCYTRQATPYPTTRTYCIEVVQNHRFNPYLQSDKPLQVAGDVSALSPDQKPVDHQNRSIHESPMSSVDDSPMF